MTASLRIGLIGLGAIGRTLAKALAAHPELRIVGVLELNDPPELPQGAALVKTAEALLGLAPDIVVECAGHGALHAHAAPILGAGVDLLVASVGALADAALEARLRDAATRGGRVLIPSGAIAGLDALGAAREAGLDQVDYTGRKAPLAWRNTRAETLVDLEHVAQPQVFYEGNARATALDFPQNANVVAAVALAGLGFERTRVRLVVDPAATSNQHRVEASGAFGRLAVEVTARVLPENPKTSMLAPYSLVRALLNRTAAIVV